MVLTNNGPIAYSDIQNEFGGTNPISISEYYQNANPSYTTGVTGIPNSGAAISVSHFQGKAKAASFTLSNLGGLANWYDAKLITGLANGNAVRTWNDVSGNARTATSTSTTSPTYTTSGINGNPCVTFTQINGVYYNCSSATANSSNFTIAIVGAPSLSTAAFSHFVATNGGWQSGSLHYLYRSTLGGNIQISINPNADATSSSLVDGTNKIIVMQATGAPSRTLTLRVNGTQVYTLGQTGAAPIILSSMNIGGWSGDSSRTYVGKMGEVAWWSPGSTSNLSLTDVQKIEGYMANKWWGLGSSNPLPSDHPYKNSAP